MATLTAHPRKASPLRSRSPGTLQGGAIIGSLHIDRDGDLVAGLRGRDGEAAEILVARYGDRLYRLAIRITGASPSVYNYTGLPGNRVQDAMVTESMGPVYDRRNEHLGTTDQAIIFFRRQLIPQELTPFPPHT